MDAIAEGDGSSPREGTQPRPAREDDMVSDRSRSLNRMAQEGVRHGDTFAGRTEGSSRGRRPRADGLTFLGPAEARKARFIVRSRQATPAIAGSGRPPRSGDMARSMSYHELKCRIHLANSEWGRSRLKYFTLAQAVGLSRAPTAAEFRWRRRPGPREAALDESVPPLAFKSGLQLHRIL